MPDVSEESTPAADSEDPASPSPEATDEDEAVVEEVTEEEQPEEPVQKMKDVIVDEWIQVNSQPPIWTRYVLINTI